MTAAEEHRVRTIRMNDDVEPLDGVEAVAMITLVRRRVPDAGGEEV